MHLLLPGNRVPVQVGFSMRSQRNIVGLAWFSLVYCLDAVRFALLLLVFHDQKVYFFLVLVAEKNISSTYNHIHLCN